MRALIAGRTKMYGGARCIGAILDDGTPIRLLRPGEHHWPVTAPFKIGEIWELTLAAAKGRAEPHTEDVIVTKYNFVGVQPDLVERILTLCGACEGDIKQLFGGMLGFTGGNNGYVAERLGVPDYSTGFWIPDRGLQLRDDGTHYDYAKGFFRRGLKYVGEPRPIPTIPAGTLVRVSLAGWWKPEEVDIEERCYLQLSGWF